MAEAAYDRRRIGMAEYRRPNRCVFAPLWSKKGKDFSLSLYFRLGKEGGISSEAQKCAQKEKLLIKEKNMILSVGQFIPRKGLDLLIQCARKIKKGAGVYLIGGTAGEDYQKIVSKTEGAQIHFVGFKTRDELKSYYMAADIFAFPTREDIWGLVLNEAMAYGLPSVASIRSIAANEMIENGENGYLVDPENIDSMAERLNFLLEGVEARRAMGQKAYQTSRKYTIEAMAKRHMEIFEEFRSRMK